MWISMLILGFLVVIFGVLYFQAVRDIEHDDINEAKAPAEPVKNKRTANGLAGV